MLQNRRKTAFVHDTLFCVKNVNKGVYIRLHFDRDLHYKLFQTI